jgi:hypothetical protein
MGTVANLKARVASYLNLETSDLIVNSIDLGLDAINSAHRYAQQQHDFEFAKVPVPYSLNLVTGGVLTPASYLGVEIEVKRVILPWSTNADGTKARPLHFEQRGSMAAALNREWGMRPWDYRMTDPPLPVSNTVLVPTLVQLGQTLSLYPADQNTWGTSGSVGLILDVVRFFPEYTQPTSDNDFILQYGTEFLFWYALQQLNKKYKEFVPREEGNLDDTYLEKERNKSWDDFLTWDAGLVFSSDALDLE